MILKEIFNLFLNQSVAFGSSWRFDFGITSSSNPEFDSFRLNSMFSLFDFSGKAPLFSSAKASKRSKPKRASFLVDLCLGSPVF